MAKRALYEKGFSKTEVCNLYKFIDWLLGLPNPFKLEYLKEVYDLEDPKKMPYISPAERFGMEKGIEKVAKHLLKDGAKPIYVKKVTGLSLIKIKALQQSFKEKNH